MKNDPKILLQAHRDLHTAGQSSKTTMNIASGYPLSSNTGSRGQQGQVPEVEQDPKNLTASLLKICKITRPKHLKVNQVHRSSGRGGAGPYGSNILSPTSSKMTPNIFSNFGSSTFYN